MNMAYYFRSGCNKLFDFVFSEGNIGGQLQDPEGTTFTFLPHSVFFEFIPVEDINKPEPNTLFLDEVSIEWGNIFLIHVHKGPSVECIGLCLHNWTWLLFSTIVYMYIPKSAWCPLDVMQRYFVLTANDSAQKERVFFLAFQERGLND